MLERPLRQHLAFFFFLLPASTFSANFSHTLKNSPVVPIPMTISSAWLDSRSFHRHFNVVCPTPSHSTRSAASETDHTNTNFPKNKDSHPNVVNLVKGFDVRRRCCPLPTR